jgi:hypothetical protein
MSDNFETALRLARAGLPVFPADPETKTPLVRFTRAATKLARGVDYHWGKTPDAAPGIHLAGAGLVVIDLDRGHDNGADGISEFERLLDQCGELPRCPAVRTPRGGVHLYFEQPHGAEQMGNSVGKEGRALGPGIDVRGFHGFVIAPGAIMSTGKFYETIAGTPDLVDAFVAGVIPEIPQWLAELAERPAVVTTPHRGPCAPVFDCDRRPFGVAVLAGEAYALANAPGGTRNHQLNKAAFVIASKAGAWDLVSEGEAWDALWSACVANGYLSDDGPKAFRRTFYSGWNDGLGDPTPLRERFTHDSAFAERIKNLCA